MILVVTAVDAERDAVRKGLPDGCAVDVVAVGVGPAAAAAGTAWHLARAPRRVDRVVCCGIAGGFSGRSHIGKLVIATRSVAADLGADGPEGFIPLDTLGFGATSLPATAVGVPGAATGAILTVSTVTGTAATAEALAARYPDAVAEGMEGFGAASAAALAGVAFSEIRAISNVVGPRDRGAWRIREALDALGTLGPLLATVDG
ncbi:Futalosine hydrolase [Virgisporangium aliadipatigenens]|uniref:Futalosine hydrolase n=1 Tax=Virgisporangium aliadipatigenens TaxID=741659 RepID=A0A8J4DPA4_9ACTN|nr:futalosine hydrolase [Virgisporangium aliadipatigenens]GIJ44428.1 Futalosine hydrolase [Virgisporangium aliadipatigenens]